MIYQKAIVSYKEVMDYLRSKSNPTETELVSYIQSKFGYKPTKLNGKLRPTDI